MKIVKVLNNSLVLALDEKGAEIILMGKGIGFHKATGDDFTPQEIEKVFVLEDRSISRNIIRLAAEIDERFFAITKGVVDYAAAEYDMVLLDHIYLALTDHIAYAVRRQKEGIEIPNFYTREMRKFNPSEYEVGRYAIALVEKEIGVKLPDDEAGNIAFHFINAQVDHPYNEKNRQIRKLTEDVLDIVKYYFQMVYREESTAYSRYLTHVRLFAQRLISGQQLPEDRNVLLFEQVKDVCSAEFDCVKRVDKYVQDRFGTALTNQEALYLAIHIYRIRVNE